MRVLSPSAIGCDPPPPRVPSAVASNDPNARHGQQRLRRELDAALQMPELAR
nr:hypothetical protein [Prescottella equi]